MISSNTTVGGVGLRPASSARAPPTIPPRNGSKLETVASPPKKYFDSNIEEHPPASPKPSAVPTANNDEVDADKKVVNGGGGYPLKSRNEAQNSFVFNFVNTKKDTSHLEYDGLDLSKRPKKVRFVSTDSKLPYSLFHM